MVGCKNNNKAEVVMELLQIKRLITLAKLKHYSRAASKLHIAQPSLSRSIQAMESQLGVPLLQRNAKQVELTDYGRLVVERGSELLAAAEALQQELKLMQGLETGEIKVGASPIPSVSLIGPIVGEFLRDYPGVDTELVVGNWKQLHTKLLEGQINLFIAETRSTYLEQKQELEFEPLPKSPAVLCCRADHPLLAQASVSLKDLRQYPLALPRSIPPQILEELSELFEKRAPHEQGIIRFEQFHPLKGSLTHCDMVALVPMLAVAKLIHSGELDVLRFQGMPEVYAHYNVVYLKNRSLPPSAFTFIDYVKRQAQYSRQSVANTLRKVTESDYEGLIT
ncbi:LysR family transcriptional regulator [Paraferrimonas sedimenticola]|uniref:LysR family transcriptional regulator n=1 Tax=Paraferrimonas sedimenticola TaxID=375674 RepID=A0AA37W0I7_9GAMM|nr:LysR family transcriptional regulator [Paraferrimonas sedimenticola]GLP95097.1 LysR family transcriptional regulator [Paraferrimonas sedimenticola]